MDYSREFITEEAISWLRSHGMRLKKGKVSKRNFSKVSVQPHTIVKQISFSNGNVLFLSLFSLFKN